MLLTRRLLLGAVATLPLTRTARGEPTHRLTLLHINDFHSRHRPVDQKAIGCTSGQDCFGSSPRLATAIREQRDAATADGRQVLLLDAGDQFQGSLFYTAHHGMAELAVQHATGTAAMALGNHEWDNGPAPLARYIEAARFPILSANTDASDEPALAARIKPWVMIEKAGLRIALIGLTTPDTATSSSPGPTIRFTDPAQALARATAEADAAGAHLTILLSHLGLATDLRLQTPGVAVIIGGHSHSLLSNTEPGALGPHPTPNPSGALIVQAQAYGRYLGRLDLDLAADGTVLAYGGACRHIGQDLAEDPEVASIVAAFAAPLEALLNRHVTTLDTPLDVTTCRLGPCELGTRVADAMRAAVHSAPPNTPPDTPVVALMNAGGLRVGLPAGPISLGQVLNTLPYGNTLATTVITGAQLAETVRHGLTMFGRGGYPQWSGLRVKGTVTPDGIENGSPPKNLFRFNLSDIEVEHAGTWSPIDPTAPYLIATNNFIRTGGDGYTVLRDEGQSPYDSGPAIADLFADSL